MDTKPNRRIAIKPDLYKALSIVALDQGTTVFKLVDTWLREHVATEPRAIWTTGILPKAGEVAAYTLKPADAPKQSNKPDPDTEAKILGAWSTGLRGHAEIGRATGIHERTVGRYVKKLKEKGKLRE